jgi:hypothetical protein
MTDQRTAGCFENCDWQFTGSAMAAKDAGIAHRRETGHQFYIEDAMGEEAVQGNGSPTRSCKIEGCLEPPLAERGRYARLCEQHKANAVANVVGQKGRRGGHRKVARPAAPDPRPPTLTELTENVRQARLALTAAHAAWEAEVARIREELTA